MEKTLVVNAGSSTLKFKLFEMPEEAVLASGNFENIGIANSRYQIKVNGQKYERKIEIADHEQAVNMLLDLLKELEIVHDYSEITAIGHRVVAGGEYFDKPVVIDEDVMKKIDDIADYAPLHNPNELKAIKVFKKVLPNAVAVAVFDTAFHQSIPEENYIYSVPYEWYEKYGVRRYGAHGTSHEYVAGKASELMGKPLSELKLITCHLGAGSSLDAIKYGKSYDTTMGFTPASGITMATRSGDVDFSLVAYVLEKEGSTTLSQAVQVLNNDSGLKGISGISADMREIISQEDRQHRAALAIKLFVRNIVRYIGQYYVEMQGLDGIVFTAGIGENSAIIRSRVIRELEFMGVKLDQELNGRHDARIISTPDSSVTVMKIPTDEELMIVRDVESLK